jgi:hypothetical protein
MLRVKRDPFANLAGWLRVTATAISYRRRGALSHAEALATGERLHLESVHIPNAFRYERLHHPLTAPANPGKFADLWPARVVAAAFRLFRVNLICANDAL